MVPTRGQHPVVWKLLIRGLQLSAGTHHLGTEPVGNSGPVSHRSLACTSTIKICMCIQLILGSAEMPN